MNAIAQLNDAFRQAGPGPGWYMTQGVVRLVSDHGSMVQVVANQLVRSFAAFTPDNDPYGEHDFGAITVAGEKLFWKIDCYDLDRRMGSPDPANPAVTSRVMTIMLASEY